MDFLTLFPYWAILVIIVVNAFVVRKMKVEVRDDPTESNTDSDDDVSR